MERGGDGADYKKGEKVEDCREGDADAIEVYTAVLAERLRRG